MSQILDSSSSDDEDDEDEKESEEEDEEEEDEEDEKKKKKHIKEEVRVKQWWQLLWCDDGQSHTFNKPVYVCVSSRRRNLTQRSETTSCSSSTSSWRTEVRQLGSNDCPGWFFFYLSETVAHSNMVYFYRNSHQQTSSFRLQRPESLQTLQIGLSPGRLWQGEDIFYLCLSHYFFNNKYVYIPTGVTRATLSWGLMVCISS